MILFTALVLAMFITIALIPLLRGLAVRLHAVDEPDERKVHLEPMPRTGGIAMVLGVFVPVLFWVPEGQLLRAVLAGAGIVALFGLADDVKGLGYRAKFTGQILAALIVIFYGGLRIKYLGTLLPEDVLLPDWIAILLTLIVIVGVTNAINLADGLDGLAGGITMLSFLCMGYLAYVGGNQFIALLCAAVVGAIFGFLRFNTHPATIFMGDTGSEFLGFLAVTLSLGLTQNHGAVSPLLPLLLLGLPVLDTLTVMIERIYKGRSPFLADSNHIHHKLMRLGLYHSESVFMIYVLQAALVTSAFLFRFHSDWLLLGMYATLSGLVILGFAYAGRTGWKLKRYEVVDRKIKGRLRVLKEKNVLIRSSFWIVKICVPALFLFTALLPARMPSYFSILSAVLLGFLLLTFLAKKQWTGLVLALAVYLSVPFLVYLSEGDRVGWMKGALLWPYNLSFVVLTVFVFLTLRFTRRRKGFKTTPMDFLVLFIALVVPNLPDEWIRSQRMGLVAAKIIVLFFSYEVLIGELRGNLGRLALATMAALALIGVRAVVG